MKKIPKWALAEATDLLPANTGYEAVEIFAQALVRKKLCARRCRQLEKSLRESRDFVSVIETKQQEDGRWYAEESRFGVGVTGCDGERTAILHVVRNTAALAFNEDQKRSIRFILKSKLNWT